MSVSQQVFWLLVLPLAIACVSWTVAKEELFRECREFCDARYRCSENGVICRKFFYMFTCEYCISHWVTIAFLLLTGYRLLLPGVAGFAVALFACVFMANLYMSLYSTVRLAVRMVRGKAHHEHELEKAAEAQVAAVAGQAGQSGTAGRTAA